MEKLDRIFRVKFIISYEEKFNKYQQEKRIKNNL